MKNVHLLFLGLFDKLVIALGLELVEMDLLKLYRITNKKEYLPAPIGTILRRSLLVIPK